MKFAFIQVIPRLVRESQIHTKKEKKEQMLAVDRGWRKYWEAGGVTAYQSDTSWCSAWLEGSSYSFWMKTALLCHVTAWLNLFLCIHLIFLGGILNICCAMNIVLQWMLNLLRFNSAFASETVLCNVLLTSALHIAALCLGLCFGFGGYLQIGTHQ